MADSKDMASKLGLTDDDQAHLQGYTKYLDTDQREAIKKMMDQRMADQSRAVEIASRGIFQDKTPEEQEFLNKQLDPGMQGLIGGGGVMGGVQSIGKAAAPIIQEGVAAAKPMAAEAMQAAKSGMSNLEQYLMKMKGLAREGGYAQRLGAEAKGAAGLSSEAGQTLTGVTKGPMEDAIIKQQLANKMRGL